ncbi:MAG: hypothetical protein MR866_08460 [Selenomonadaceae bacterium]|nr:hypothetical protein [Selenomonadaceae bacterium]
MGRHRQPLGQRRPRLGRWLELHARLDLSFYRLKPFDANASDAGHFSRYDDIALASFTYCF